MRQGQEHHVRLAERLGRGRLEDPVGELREVRVQIGERRAGAGPGAERAEGELGMGEQQPEQLSPGVPARAGHRRGHRHQTTIQQAA